MKYSTTFRELFLNTQHAGSLKGEHITVLRQPSVDPFNQFILYLNIEDHLIKQAHFESSSTPALIVVGEYVCRWLENKSPSAARGLQKEQILQELGLDRHFIHIADMVCRLLERVDQPN